jgi:hypothetical protein
VMNGKQHSHTMFGHFKYNVMPFGLMNALIIFQYMMNDIFKGFLDKFMIINIHDILIFSKNLKEHEQHVCLVFNKLWEKRFEVKLKRSCLFHQSKVGFLSYIIFSDGLSMGSKKIQIVINWQMPYLFCDIRYFLGFANFYQIYIENYSKIVTPLAQLMQARTHSHGMKIL